MFEAEAFFASRVSKESALLYEGKAFMYTPELPTFSRLRLRAAIPPLP